MIEKKNENEERAKQELLRKYKDEARKCEQKLKEDLRKSGHKVPEKTRPKTQLEIPPKPESKIEEGKIFYGGITEDLHNNDHISDAAKIQFSRHHLKCTPKSFDNPDNPPKHSYPQSKMAEESKKSLRYMKMLDDELQYWGHIEKIHRPGKTATTILKGRGKRFIEFEFKNINGELKIVGLKMRMSPERRKKYGKQMIKRFKELCKKQGIEW